jgi:phage tail protein X
MAKTLAEMVDGMIEQLSSISEDAAKADGGNAQAGRRFRAGIAALLPMIKEAKAQSLGK